MNEPPRAARVLSWTALAVGTVALALSLVSYRNASPFHLVTRASLPLGIMTNVGSSLVPQEKKALRFTLLGLSIAFLALFFVGFMAP